MIMRDEYNIVEDNYWTLLDKDTVLYQNVLDIVRDPLDSSTNLITISTYVVILTSIFVVFGNNIISDSIILILGLAIWYMLYKRIKFPYQLNIY